MANKTQWGIIAVIIVIVAVYFGLDLSQHNLASPKPAQVNLQDQQDDSEQFDSKLGDNRHFQNTQSNSRQNQQGLKLIHHAFDAKLSNVQVQAVGRVKAVLRDDDEGIRHQKFILALDHGLTVLVAHNIDLAPRIENLRQGDTVEFFGEYEYSHQGGVIHWTHHDPRNKHENGWLKHHGKIYQ